MPPGLGDWGVDIGRAQLFFRQARTICLRRVGFLKKDWSSELSSELDFWESVLPENSLIDDPRSQEWRRNCTDPNLALQEELKELIPASSGSVVKILDVGSGPLCVLGKRWPGREVQIIAVDPLANEYNALFAKLSMRPLVPPTAGCGEKLLEQFAPDTFDLAYARNSLDHSFDPLLAIQNMVTVIKPGHFVYLWHAANEGVRQQYTGLHQWNFNIRHGEFIVGNGQRTDSVTAFLATKAKVSCEFQTAPEGHKIIVTRIKKNA